MAESILSFEFATSPENNSFFDVISPSTNSAIRGATGTSSGIRTHTVTILNRLPPTDWATEAYVGGLTGHFPLCTGYPTAANGGTFIECVRLQSLKPLCTYGLVRPVGHDPTTSCLKGKRSSN